MDRDPVRIEETRSWFSKARIDLQAAGADLAAVPPIPEDVLFHCQQAVEKTLKGFLTWHDVHFRRTHDIVEIGNQCVAIDNSLNELLRRAAPLTEFAWLFRYPGPVDVVDVNVAQQNLELAIAVYDEIRSRLPMEISG